MKIHQLACSIVAKESIKMKFCQTGRSMIEMLGVLAIIGVLSIGGLYAYRQAMHKYQSNQLIDFIGKFNLAAEELCYKNETCLFGGTMQVNAVLICPYVLEFCTGNTPSQWFYETSFFRWKVSGSSTQIYLTLLDLPADVCQTLVRLNATNLWGIAVGDNAYERTQGNNFLSDTQKNTLAQQCIDSDTKSLSGIGSVPFLEFVFYPYK